MFQNTKAIINMYIAKSFIKVHEKSCGSPGHSTIARAADKEYLLSIMIRSSSIHDSKESITIITEQ